MHISKINEFFLNRLNILLLSFFLGLGKIAYSSEGFGPIHFLVVTFIALSLINAKKVIPQFINIKSIILFLLVIFLSISELINFNVFYAVDTFNLKLIVSIFFFIVFSDYLNRDKGFVDFILLSFSLGVVTLLLISLYFPEIGYYHKGKYMIMDENPNSTGTRFALAAVFLCYFIVRGFRNNFILFLCLLSYLILIYFTILTGSRGSLIFLIVSSWILVLYSRRSYLFKISIFSSSLFIIVAGFGLLLNMEGDIGQKWNLATEGDIAGRDVIWDIALGVFFDNPYMGVGQSQYLYNMTSALGSAKDTHNLFIFLLSTGGIVAFSLYIIFFFYLLNRAVKTRHSDNGLRLSLWLGILILALKTGGALVYLVLWFLYAIINSRQYTDNRII